MSTNHLAATCEYRLKVILVVLLNANSQKNAQHPSNPRRRTFHLSLASQQRTGTTRGGCNNSVYRTLPNYGEKYRASQYVSFAVIFPFFATFILGCHAF